MKEYIIANKSDLVAIADAIRAKSGSTESLELPTGFVEVVDGITGSAPDGSDVTFGHEQREAMVPVADGKAYYNGVLLPKIPEDVLAEYPYAWIRKDDENGKYDVNFGKATWYFNGSGMSCSDASSLPFYSINYSEVSNATEWVFQYDNKNGTSGIASNRTVLWSNHDIPNGSATATDIYFKGSEPVTEIKTTTSVPVEREEKYVITSADLNELGVITQKVVGKKSLMTVAEMITLLNRAQFTPQGYAESTLMLNFTSTASGILPTVYTGAATSTLALNFTSSATGALQED